MLFRSGVNGEWWAWWTDDEVRQGRSYAHDRPFDIETVGDQPILIRDDGIEWDGCDTGNERLDKVQLDIGGPDHLRSIDALGAAGQIQVLSSAANNRRIKVSGRTDSTTSTRHDWTILIEKL